MFILHGTLGKNVIPILESKKLKTGGLHRRTVIRDPPTDQLFTQLVYKGIPYQATQQPYHYDCCFVFDSSVLKKLPFYAVTCGGFGSTFSEGMEKKAFHLARGSGKCQRMPILKRLKTTIDATLVDRPWLQSLAFIHSHEVMFGQDIPLEKFCVAVIIHPRVRNCKKIEELAGRLKINVIKIVNASPGLDNCIDLITANMTLP